MCVRPVRQGRQTVPSLGGPAVPGARDCTKSGEKCAGAANFPSVPFAECCDDRLVCGTPKSPPSGEGGWGKYCILSKDAAPDSEETMTPTTTAGTTTAAAATNAGATTTAGATTASSAESSAEPSGGAAAGGSGGTDVSPSPEDGTSSGGAAGGTTSETPTPEDDDDGSVCFPGSVTVELEDGSTIPMSQVSIGDRVKVGENEFSRVFMFTHKMSDTSNKFVKFSTASGAELTLTPGHYIYVDGSLVAASSVSVGSTVRLGNGKTDTVVAVSRVVDSGLYNPQTVHGDVVVNGIVSSTYTMAVEPTIAHAILSPLRALYALTGLQLNAFEKGGGFLADIAPRGAAM